MDVRAKKMSEPDFDKMAREWITRLEQEYWENSPCKCRDLLAELLRKAFDEGRKTG